MGTNQFFDPITSAKRSQLIFWGAACLLITVKLFQGDQSFFVKHFGHLYEPGPVLDWMKWLYHHIASLILYALIPMGIIKLMLNQQLSEYGWQLGDWRFGIKATLIAFVVMPLPVYLSSQNPEHLAFYPLTTLATESPTYFGLWALTYLPHYLGWEFMFRGYLQFGIQKENGTIPAILVPSLITTLLHIGKPQGETWGALIGGLYFALLTFRTKSILWALLFHWYLGMLNSWFTGIQ